MSARWEHSIASHGKSAHWRLGILLTESRCQPANGEVGEGGEGADSCERYMFLPARPAKSVVGVVRVWMGDEHNGAVGGVAGWKSVS